MRYPPGGTASPRLWAVGVLVLLAGSVGWAHGQVGQVAQAPAGSGLRVRHDLRVTLEPATGRIAVSDTIALPQGTSREFVLNGRLAIAHATPAVEEVPAVDARGSVFKRYRLQAPSASLRIEYSGVIDYALSAPKEEYTRGFRETAGIVSKEGVYLGGSSGWYPEFAGAELVEFALEANAPRGWQVISQGTGTSRGDDGAAHWVSRDPMDEIYLVGGPLVVSRRQAGAVETLVYLHAADEALAGRYLVTGGQYIDMYSALIGPYPYGKFALVENFWDTGYGMPSFTLLGPSVIRFPFILHSSYPHEILHNWWGNSVFVDYARGNWCEGLTAYLADHLVQEQQAKGADYRRGTLQKYRDYVKEGRDFPLSAFRARESAATEAVGYGKSLMVFHMLRRAIGDVSFTAALARLYREFRGRTASWGDVERSAEAAASRTLAPFFTQWLSRAGAAALDTRGVVVRSRGTGFVVAGTLAQTQAGAPYQLVVPLVVQTANGSVTREVALNGASAPFEIACPSPPLALHVDPYFDVFRLLDPRETPPSIGQVFGELHVLAVLPSSAPSAMLAGYRALVEGWQSDSQVIDVKLDSEIAQLPADRAVWLLGADNRFARSVFDRQPGLVVRADRFTVDGQAVARTSSVVLMTRHPSNAEKAIGWIVAASAAPLPALGRKLPHYGKYSYLAFEGADATNTLSGQWQNVDSPRRIDLRRDRAGALPALPPDPAKALAQLPPAR